MTYSSHATVRLIAGRLALDFLNTANWTDDGQVCEEKIETHADLDKWLQALDLSDAQHPASITELHELRSQLRAVFQRQHPVMNLSTTSDVPLDAVHPDALRHQPILQLVRISAASILSDTREFNRVKTCPGVDCGWMFLDETKNARRKWCIMETCGNRAKAARNYAKRVKSKR